MHQNLALDLNFSEWGKFRKNLWRMISKPHLQISHCDNTVSVVTQQQNLPFEADYSTWRHKITFYFHCSYKLNVVCGHLCSHHNAKHSRENRRPKVHFLLTLPAVVIFKDFLSLQILAWLRNVGLLSSWEPHAFNPEQKQGRGQVSSKCQNGSTIFIICL